MRWYVINDGRVQEIPHKHLVMMQEYHEDDELNEAADDLASGTYGIMDRHIGSDTVYAYAETPEEALEMARRYAIRRMEPDNVWCSICNEPHIGLSF